MGMDYITDHRLYHLDGLVCEGFTEAIHYLTCCGFTVYEASDYFDMLECR